MVRGILLKYANEAGTMTIDQDSHCFCIHCAIARSCAVQRTSKQAEMLTIAMVGYF
jgi:hypothetical protein